MEPDNTFCPYVTCFVREPHTHPSCSLCGAHRYGNAWCGNCANHWPAGFKRSDGTFVSTHVLGLRLMNGRQN